MGVPLAEAQKLLASTYAGFTVTGPPEGAEAPVPEAPGKVWVKTHDGQVSAGREGGITGGLTRCRDADKLLALGIQDVA